MISRRYVFLIIAVLVLVISGCVSTSYEGRTAYINSLQEHGDFEPSQDQINGALDHLRGVARRSGRKLLSWDEYKFQYTGYLEEGKEYISINAFCSEHSNWRRKWVFVLDGGNCYFSATYDLLTKDYISFYINGVA